MKRLLALLLALVMILSVFAGCSRDPDEPENPTDVTTEPTEVDDGICESAQECVDNITVGWNLGCSLSAFSKTTIDGWGVMAYFHTVDKIYSRSEVFSFDPETKTAEITWKLGKDGGVMQVYEGALMDYIGIELWNFSLSEADILHYSIDELRYVTTQGEVIVTDGLGEKSTDMGGGTGGGYTPPETGGGVKFPSAPTYTYTPPNLGGVTNVPGAIVGGARDTVGGVGSAVGGLLGQ